jgi:hypothetical protein
MSTTGKSSSHRSETPVSSAASDEKDEGPAMKVPDTYDGNRSKLQAFLTQAELYMMFKAKKFHSETEQVLFIVSLLRGAAYNWISPFLIDFLKNKTGEGRCSKDMKKETLRYFMTMKGFGEGINQVFGDIEEEKTAERGLQHLRQKGSAANYTAEFQQLATRTQWGEAALQAQYYRGLKDSVKDEISRSDKPDDLNDMIQMAVKIDNRLYERTLEKKGAYSNDYKKEKKHGRHYHSPMELDATFKHKRKTLSKDELEKRRKNKLCFECGLPGHMASSHRKGGAPWKKKQLHATGRGGYDLTNVQARPQQHLCVMEGVETMDFAITANLRRGRQVARLSEEEREEQAICTQVTGDSSDGEGGGTPIRGNLHQELSNDGLSDDDYAPCGSECSGAEELLSQTKVEWPTTWPQEGQTWEVVRREVFRDTTGNREWLNQTAGTVWREPGEAVAGGPEWGTRWEVVYQDHRRIGWREENGDGTYMLHVPQPEPTFDNDEPRVMETWELMAQGRKERLWMDTNDETKFFRESHVPGKRAGFTIGQVYRLVQDEDPVARTARQWLNVLFEYKEKPKRELAAGGETGQLVCQAKIKGHRVQAMIDSGATGNFISPNIVRMLYLGTMVKAQSYTLTVVNGETIDGSEGTIDVETHEVIFEMPGGHTEYTTFDVAPIGRHDIILGMPWMKMHNPTIDWKKHELRLDRCTHKCLQKHRGRLRNVPLTDPEEVCATSRKESGYPTTEDPLLKRIPEEYQEYLNLFKEELGIEALPQHGPWDHDIPLEEGKEPPFSPIYQMSEADLGTLREYIDENLAKGFIRPSTSPAGSPVLFVPKKDGKKRLCVDYRKLNAITVKDRYALPLADELRDRLVGAKIFTKLDLRGAYNLVRMKEGEEWKTAFRCRYGHYEYLVMPFGLTNAPASCMRMMNDVLRPYLDKTCIAYLDDILVYSQTIEQHIKDVRTVLKALEGARLACKPEKCEFHMGKVEFLGYVVTPGGLSMDPIKVATILDWAAPSSVKETQSFLGFANFYRRFVKGYSAIAAPLTELTKKDQDFAWNNKAQIAFDALKVAFTQAPILLTFDPEKEIVVETDSSDYALGAVLSQRGETSK